MSTASDQVEAPSSKFINLVVPDRKHAIFSPASCHDKPCNKSKHILAKNPRRVHKAREIPRPLKVSFFLEVFSGSGKLASCMARHVSMVVTWDVLHGPDYDLSIRANQHVILGWILAGWIIGLHLGTPCSSFSRVRDRAGGPPRLRSDACPLGLPSLRPGDHSAVRLGNCLMYFSARCLRLCLYMHVPATLENPRMSRLWLCKPMAAIARNQFVSFNHIDFCMFGTPWKKPTGVLSCFLDLAGCSRFQCQGCPPGQCARTGKRHFILTGVDEHGQFWTKRAEPYPTRFCSFIARLFANYFAKRAADRFGSYVLGCA